MKEKEMNAEMEIPEGTEVKVEGKTVSAKGAKGECQKTFSNPRVRIDSKDGKITLSVKNATKKDKTMLGTYKAHVMNVVKGASEGFEYKLKICSGHFPMNVSVSGDKIEVKNFLGEKSPRSMKIKEGATVKVEGEIITVEGCSKEIAGQTAGDIEKLTAMKNRDKRIFQDGIYITEKAGKPVR